MSKMTENFTTTNDWIKTMINNLIDKVVLKDKLNINSRAGSQLKICIYPWKKLYERFAPVDCDVRKNRAKNMAAS